MAETRKLTLSVADGKTSRIWRKLERSWKEIARGVSKVKVGRKDDAPCWSPAVFRDGRRSKHNAVEISLITFDSDAGHTVDELGDRVRANGWAAVIASTSSHNVKRTEIQASTFDKWKARHGGEDASLEAFLIQTKHMLARVAAGAKEIRRFTQWRTKGKKRIATEMIEIEHRPCPKYRVVLRLPRPWRVEDYPDPETAQRAWENAYIAIAEKLGLRFDETCRGVDRMFFLTRVSADRLPEAESVEIEGADCPALDLAPTLQTAISGEASADGTATRRGSDKREHRDRKQQSFKSRVISDGMTGKIYSGLQEWAREVGPRFQLANAVRDRGEVILDLRGEVDGKQHIECPFSAEHTSALAHPIRDAARF